MAQHLSDLGHEKRRENGRGPAVADVESDSSDEDGKVANDGTLLASDPPKPL